MSMVADPVRVMFSGPTADSYVLGVVDERLCITKEVEYLRFKERVLRFGPATVVFPELKASVLRLKEAGLISVAGDPGRPDTWRIRRLYD